MALATDFITFDQGLDRIRDAIRKSGVKGFESRVVTSKDADVAKVIEMLSIDRLPKGFRKWQLPVAFASVGAQFFITNAEAGSRAAEHSHNNGDAMRVILTGSIRSNGVELKEGDWMFIPKDVPYSFEVGPRGVSMFYCYCCCCVPV